MPTEYSCELEPIEQPEERLENDELPRECVANLLRDLRTPLSALEGCLETLSTKGDLSAAEQRQYLGSVRKHAVRPRSLINATLELSSLDEILDLHGCPIFVSSEVGVGTRFEFELCLDNTATCMGVQGNRSNPATAVVWRSGATSLPTSSRQALCRPPERFWCAPSGKNPCRILQGAADFAPVTCWAC